MIKPNRTFLALAALVLLAGCRQPNQFVPPPPPTVSVAHPIEKTIPDSVEFIGVAQPTKMVELRARVNGYLQKIFFDDGSDVQVGDPLFQIDPAPYQSVLDAAKAAQQRAVASLALAQSQYRRMEPLITNSVITQEELDVQAAQVETTKADVAAAEAAVRKAELDLGYTKISAPIAGRIGRHLVDVGNLVLAEQTQLASIKTLDPIYGVFDVSENDLLRFMAMLRNNELPDPEKFAPVLHLGLSNEEGHPHEGRLDFRELSINPGTGTAMRRGIFPNPGRQIIPGMDVRIQANVGDAKPRVLVEDRAIGSDQRGDYMLVVNDKNVVEYRPVKLGPRFDTMRVVDSGVKATDWVIVNGLQRARPGAQVKPEPVTAEDGMAKGDSPQPTEKPSDEKSQGPEAPAKVATATAPPKDETPPPAPAQPAAQKQ
jgi:RND family efflux transporter MFP subunit